MTGHFLELITLFGTVIIHELGHVWAAREVGWSIREIRLLPFGGVAEVEQQGNSTPAEEIFVALAGPLQHIWMIFLSIGLETIGWWSVEWSSYFIQANIFIGLFNLMPILPLDGGKVMQALLSFIFPYYRTLLVCTIFSILLSCLIFFYAALPFFYGLNMNLLIVSLFLFFSNWYEYRLMTYRFMRFLTNRLHGDRDAKHSPRLFEPLFVPEHTRMHDIVRMFHKGKTHHVFVIDHRDRVKATLSEQELLDIYFHL